MNKVTKTICLIAAGMIAFGLALAGFAYLMGADTSIRVGSWGNSWNDNWSYKSANKMEINEKQLEDFHTIDLDVFSQAVQIQPGAEFSLHSVYNGEYTKVDYQVKNGVLTFKETELKKYFGWSIVGVQDFFMNGRTRGTLIITYPVGSRFDNVTIKSNMAGIRVEDMNAGRLNIDADMGTVELNNVHGASLDVDTDMGSISLKKSSFDVIKLKCDLGEIDADGLLCRKNFTAEGNMGSIDLEGEFLGETRITCDLGDVDISLRGSREDYRYDLDTDLGGVEIDGVDYGSRAKSDSGENYLYVENSLGGIQIEFK